MICQYMQDGLIRAESWLSSGVEKMGCSKDEILNLAVRYLNQDEITDFPYDNDTFFFTVRELIQNKVLGDEEGWHFRGYAVCHGYTFDEESKPRGKWVWMHFSDLATFPPTRQTMKLQPPHVVKGKFQNPERTVEIRFTKVDFNAKVTVPDDVADENDKQKPDSDSKIIKFRPKA